MKMKIRKFILLLIYRKICLNKYISDYNMNCYIWKDENADSLFPIYISMMKQIYKMDKENFEIEILDDKLK